MTENVRKEKPHSGEKGLLLKCGFDTEIDHHPFKALSPRCFLVPKRPMNGLSMTPRPNQASLSARALSSSPEELGMKYLDHREETKASDTDSLFKTSTSFQSRRQITQLLTICKKVDALQHTWSGLASTSSDISVLQHSVGVSHRYVYQLWVLIRGSWEQNRWPKMKSEHWACVLFVTDLPVTRGHGDTTQQREQDEQQRRHSQVMHHHRLEYRTKKISFASSVNQCKGSVCPLWKNTLKWKCVFVHDLNFKNMCLTEF